MEEQDGSCHTAISPTPRVPGEFLKVKFIHLLIHRPSDAFLEQDKLWPSRVFLCGGSCAPKTTATAPPVPSHSAA